MKRMLLAVLAVGCLTVLAAAPVSAQGLRWGVNGGLLMPMGDYNDLDKPGWIVGGGATYWLTGGQIGVRGDFSYGQTKHDGGFTGDTKIAGGMASLVYGFGPSTAAARPFVTGGLGFYNVKFEFTGAGASSTSETKVAFGLGAGVRFKLGTGGTGVTVATRFTSVSLDPSVTFLPITVGVNFGK
jgi:opacity protein-like surface antigen